MTAVRRNVAPKHPLPASVPGTRLRESPKAVDSRTIARAVSATGRKRCKAANQNLELNDRTGRLRVLAPAIDLLETCRSRLANVSEELVAKRVEILKEAFPSTTRIGVLGNISNPGQAAYLKAVQDAAHRLGAEARIYPVEDHLQLAPAFAVKDLAKEMHRLLCLWHVQDTAELRTR